MKKPPQQGCEHALKIYGIRRPLRPQWQRMRERHLRQGIVALDHERSLRAICSPGRVHKACPAKTSGRKDWHLASTESCKNMLHPANSAVSGKAFINGLDSALPLAALQFGKLFGGVSQSKTGVYAGRKHRAYASLTVDFRHQNPDGLFFSSAHRRRIFKQPVKNKPYIHVSMAYV